MRLIAYPTVSVRPAIRPAPATRRWLDELPQAFGYRCLPLNIASAHGWEILCPSAFEARWNGGIGKDAIEITPLGPQTLPPATHFGSGILTFHTGYLFRSEPGYNLWVQGPVNDPKDGIAALSGVIETDWSPYTFTMNWKFTRAGHTVRFEVDEPFCHFFPVPRELVESIEPELRQLSSDPETEALQRQWSESRRTFNLELLEPQSEARKEKWQKNYYLGTKPDGLDSGVDHQAKLRLRPFADKLAKEDQDLSETIKRTRAVAEKKLRPGQFADTMPARMERPSAADRSPQTSGIADSSKPASRDRIARNTPCPCGSGKKYKHCHGKVT